MSEKDRVCVCCVCSREKEGDQMRKNACEGCRRMCMCNDNISIYLKQEENKNNNKKVVKTKKKNIMTIIDVTQIPVWVCVRTGGRNEKVDELNAMHVGNDDGIVCMNFWALMLILCMLVCSHTAAAAVVHILPAVLLILPMSGPISREITSATTEGVQ